MNRIAFFLALVVFPAVALAQDGTGRHEEMQQGRHNVPDIAVPMDHGTHADDGTSRPTLPDGITEGGQSAFSAIQEIVTLLMADPDTEWSRVDIEALRKHLIDMNNVTLRAEVETQDIDGGARFLATSDDPAVTASIRAMVPAHVTTMNGVEGWQMQAEDIPSGAALTVTGTDTARIRALGFIGIMTVGMHHQGHHYALASGENPHAH